MSTGASTLHLPLAYLFPVPGTMIGVGVYLVSGRDLFGFGPLLGVPLLIAGIGLAVGFHLLVSQ